MAIHQVRSGEIRQLEHQCRCFPISQMAILVEQTKFMFIIQKCSTIWCLPRKSPDQCFCSFLITGVGCRVGGWWASPQCSHEKKAMNLFQLQSISLLTYNWFLSFPYFWFCMGDQHPHCYLNPRWDLQRLHYVIKHHFILLSPSRFIGIVRISRSLI
jgi:hypothetical protein